jgi:hypothetical protein
MTALTDLVVALVCFFAFSQLHNAGKKDPAVFYYKYFFLCLGISTTLGGLTGHAFQYALGFTWKVPGWIAGMCAIAFIGQAAIMEVKKIIPPVTSNVFAYINIVSLCVLMFIALYALNFSYVEIHATVGLVAVFLLQLFIYFKSRLSSSTYIMYGVGAAALAAATHVGKISPHTWFNHLDLSHILMATSCYFYYLGAVKINLLHDEKTAEEPSAASVS